MNEVASLAARTVLEMARRAGVPAETLLAGMELTPASLGRVRRVSWDEFCTIIERLEALVGGPQAWQALVRQNLHTSVPRELAWVTLGLLSPTLIYRLVFGIVAPALFPNLDLDVSELSDQRLRLSCSVRAGSRPCRAFLEGCAAGVEHVYAHLGLPDPEVVVEELTDRRAVASLTLPPTPPLLARLGRVGAVGLATLGRTLLFHLSGDVAALGRTAYDQAVVLAEVKELGLELADVHDVAALDAKLVPMLLRLGWREIALYIVPAEGAVPRLSWRHGAAPGAPRVELPLVLGVRTLGHLEVAGDGDARLSSELAPWIAIALGRVMASVGPADLSERMAEMRRAHALTARQTEILEQVARGASNHAIAVALACTERTVESHVTSLLRKLHAASRTELIARVWQPPVDEPGR